MAGHNAHADPIHRPFWPGWLAPGQVIGKPMVSIKRPPRGAANVPKPKPLPRFMAVAIAAVS
jgi:hypothetical protein